MKRIWLMSAALFACASNDAATMPTTVTSAGMDVEVEPAVEQITNDRCNRQLSCGNVGKGHTWRDRTACERDMDKKVHVLLGRSCTVVDAARLHTCLNDLRDQLCDQTGTAPVSCEGVTLCH